MGNHQIYPKRQHRPSESVGFAKQNHDDDDGRFVTLPKTKNRIWTKSAPPLEETLIAFESMCDRTTMTFSTPLLPFDKFAAITGTFTRWIEEPMFQADGEFRKTLQIPPGCHYYRILVNGRARFRKDETIEDHPKFGRVQFVYIAPIDPYVTNPLERTLLALPKLNDWSQDSNPPLISTNLVPAPPRIPPHLLDILLNRQLPAHWDPHLLPEPNSVTLQHLYALSIQNGMMILSTSIRYKRKFVTLCFYKPI